MALDTLDIPINSDTRKKLGALAVLMGKDFDSLKEEISETLNAMISGKIIEVLGNIDGVTYTDSNEAEEDQESSEEEGPRDDPRQPPRKASEEITNDYLDGLAGSVARAKRHAESFYESKLKSRSADTEEYEDGNELSDDIDKEEAMEMADVPTARTPTKQAPVPKSDEFIVPPIAVPSSDNDVEAFLDTIFDSAAPTKRAVSSAKKTFDIKKPRVKISEHTGDDESDELPFLF